MFLFRCVISETGKCRCIANAYSKATTVHRDGISATCNANHVDQSRVRGAENEDKDVRGNVPVLLLVIGARYLYIVLIVLVVTKRKSE